MSHSILLFLFAFVKIKLKKKILFVMTLLSNITEKCKNEVSVNIINLFFETYVGFQKILILSENLNL